MLSADGKKKKGQTTMLKEEFERLAKRTVTPEQYDAIEALYTASDMNKQDFVQSIKGLLKHIPEARKYARLVMAVHNDFYEIKTPNGCYYMTVLVDLLDVDIKTGKIRVRKVPNSFELRYGYDIIDWEARVTIEE